MTLEPTPASLHTWGKALTRPQFWVIVILLIWTTLIHYLTPQTEFLPSPVNTLLSRHAVERIVFVLPVVVATNVFRWQGGVFTLVLAVLAMLPRAIWISSSPGDALVETAAAAVVGSLAIWAIEAQAREKILHQRTASRLSAISAVNAIVTRSLDPEQLLGAALEQVLRVTGLEAGLVFLLEEQSQELHLADHRGISEKAVAELERQSNDAGIFGQVARSGKLAVVQDASQQPPAMQKEGLQAQVIVPLQSNKRVQGVLAVASKQARQFPSQDLELLTAIGNEIGVGVENAQLHWDLARQLQIQQHLKEVAEEITSQLELDKILPRVLQIAEELVGADAGGIALYGEDGESIRYPYLHNLPQELADLPIAKGSGVAGEVMATGRSTIFKDYQIHPDAIPAFAQTGLATVAGVPIVSGDSSFGALSVASINETKHFSDSDIAILTGIGRQAGIAIENARLYESMRFYAQKVIQAQEKERARIARELHDETIQMLIVISRRLELLAAALPENTPQAVQQILASLQESIHNTQQGVRSFAQGLRPPTLDHLGLAAATRGLTNDLAKDEGIETALIVTGESRRLAANEELALFRIAQEAMNNARRHAGASRVIVQLEFHPDRIQMTIEDNGCGFNVPTRMNALLPTGRRGLVCMDERAHSLGGTLAIHSRLGQGTVVTVEIPVQPELEQMEHKAQETGLI